MNNQTKHMTPDFLGASEFLILIPKTNLHNIAAGSGVVAKPFGPDFQIDYEGNLYGASNVTTLEQKLLHAAGRSAENYPTIARLWATKENMLENFEIAGVLDHEALKENLKARTYYGEESEVEAVQKSADIYPEQRDKLQAWAKKQV